MLTIALVLFAQLTLEFIGLVIELLPTCLEVLSPKAMGLSCVGGMAFMFCAKSLSHELLSSFGMQSA